MSLSVISPHCGYCKALAPEYEEAATSLKDKDIKLAKVDCTKEDELCKSFNVESYPTLDVFRGLENISVYRRARKAISIVSYITKQSLPAISHLTKDTLEAFKTADKVVLVGYFAADDKGSFANFTITDPDLAKVEGASFPSVILYKAFDEGKSILSNTIDTEVIGEFISTASLPLIGELDPETHPGYVAKRLPLAYIFVGTEQERTELVIALKPIAENYRSAISFVTVDAEAFGHYASNLHLLINKWPAFVIQDTITKKKFLYDQDTKITAKSIGEFV